MRQPSEAEDFKRVVNEFATSSLEAADVAAGVENILEIVSRIKNILKKIKS